MNIKALLTSTLLTALFAGTFAFAQYDPHANDFIDNTSASVKFVKISVPAPVTDYENVVSGRK